MFSRALGRWGAEGDSSAGRVRQVPGPQGHVAGRGRNGIPEDRPGPGDERRQLLLHHGTVGRVENSHVTNFR